MNRDVQWWVTWLSLWPPAARYALGCWLQSVAGRLLSTPRGLPRLQGDQLTSYAVALFDVQRETDDELRARCLEHWRKV